MENPKQPLTRWLAGGRPVPSHMYLSIDAALAGADGRREPSNYWWARGTGRGARRRTSGGKGVSNRGRPLNQACTFHSRGTSTIPKIRRDWVTVGASPEVPCPVGDQLH